MSSALLSQIQREKIALMQSYGMSQQRVIQPCTGTVQPGLFSCVCSRELNRSEAQAQVLTSCHPDSYIVSVFPSTIFPGPTSTFQNLVQAQFEGTTC